MKSRLNARRSPIWKISSDELKNVIKESKSITEILFHFKLKNIGGNYKTLKQRLAEEGIDYSHIPRGMGHRKGRKYPGERLLSLEECLKTLFIISSDKYRSPVYSIKRYIRQYNLLPYICSDCKIESTWNNKPLSLQIDHIDGNTCNNKLTNLRWMCPNCHSQTNTFAGKKLKIYHSPTVSELDPNWRHRPCFKKRKVVRPSKEELSALVLEFPIEVIGKKYEVSGNAIRRWCRGYNMDISFKRGYWQKKKFGKL